MGFLRQGVTQELKAECHNFGAFRTYLVDFLNTTDSPSVRTIVVVRRIDIAIAIKAQVVREDTERRCRPIATLVTDIAQTAIFAVTITRSRVPNGLTWTKLAREIHTSVTAVELRALIK